MSEDIFFDTSHEGKSVDTGANLVANGDDINVNELDPALKRIHIGLGWDLHAFDADALDLDASCLLLDKNGQTLEDEDFVFYNNLECRKKAVIHHGDSRTGAGDGDDESLVIDLTKVPFDIMHITFAISIYQGFEKEQNLGMVKNAYLRLVNADTTEELLRYVLEGDLKDRPETAMVVAMLDREGPKWHFRPKAEFATGGLEEIASERGIIITQTS